MLVLHVVLAPCNRWKSRSSSAPSISPSASLGASAKQGGLRLTAALLQHDLIAILQPAEHFRPRAVGYSNVDGNLILPLFPLGIGNLDGSLLVLIVENGAFRNLQHVLMLLQNNLRVRGHLGFQFAARILDRNPNFERSDVVLLHAHRRNLGDLAVERLVLKRFHFYSCRLSQIDP